MSYQVLIEFPSMLSDLEMLVVEILKRQVSVEHVS